MSADSIQCFGWQVISWCGRQNPAARRWFVSIHRLIVEGIAGRDDRDRDAPISTPTTVATDCAVRRPGSRARGHRLRQFAIDTPPDALD